MLVPGLALAHPAVVHGLVLAVVSADRIVVRHDAYLGHSAGLTTFRIVSVRALGAARAGSTIAARVDADEAVPTLSDVRVLGAESLTSAASESGTPEVLRRVSIVSLGEYTPTPRFVDQLGRPFTLKDLAGGPVVMAFIYTRCRDARECPLTTAKFKQLQTLFMGTATQLVLVTLDPAHDTAPVLARYAKTFGADPARWRFATGDPEAVLDFAARYQVTAFADDRVGLIHPDRTVVLDGFGAVRELIDESSWSPQEIATVTGTDQHLGTNPIARINLWLSEKAVAVCGNGVAGFSGFTDLLLVLAIATFFTFLLVRLARGIARGVT